MAIKTSRSSGNPPARFPHSKKGPAEAAFQDLMEYVADLEGAVAEAECLLLDANLEEGANQIGYRDPALSKRLFRVLECAMKRGE